MGLGNKKSDDKQEHLYTLWKGLKNNKDTVSKVKFQEVEDKHASEYFEKVKTLTQGTDCDEGRNASNDIWKLKKHIFPQSREAPTAMMDEEGNLITNGEAIKDMAAKAYQKRLANRPMAEGMEDIKTAKEKLAEDIMTAHKEQNLTPL